MLNTTLNRRALIGATAGLSAAALAGPAVVAQEASPAASPVAAGWTFTDDKGVTVTADAVPTRIVADLNAAAPLWDFGIRPVAVFGWNATTDGEFGEAGGNVDPAAVEVVGAGDEPFQPEAVVAVDPDLLVTITWSDDPADYWSFTEPAIIEQAKEIAPLVAIAAYGLADVNTNRFAELAASLGADLETPELVEAKAAYDDALASFPEQVAAKSDLSVLFLYAGSTEEPLYIANPAGWADLSLYQKLGVNIVVPEGEMSEWWQELSWEEALKYPADVVFHSWRPGTMSIEEMQAHPTLGQHPAIKAGQVGEWNQDFIMSWQGMTAALDSISAPILAAEKLT